MNKNIIQASNLVHQFTYKQLEKSEILQMKEDAIICLRAIDTYNGKNCVHYEAISVFLGLISAFARHLEEVTFHVSAQDWGESEPYRVICIKQLKSWLVELPCYPKLIT